jgi:hypothetical protein
MGHLDRILGVTALALGLLVLTGVLFTDTYTHAAQAEANGYDALAHLIVNDADSVYLSDSAPAVPVFNSDRVVAQ